MNKLSVTSNESVLLKNSSNLNNKNITDLFKRMYDLENITEEENKISFILINSKNKENKFISSSDVHIV